MTSDLDAAALAEANRATVLRLMAALDKCDHATIREIIAEDAPWWVLGVGEMDRETLIGQLERMLGSARVAETRILGTTAEGERVAVESKGNFEFTDGRTYRNNYHHLFVVRDGRVVGVREYLDLRVAEAAFGPLPVNAA
jgi:ketosteroid isomerase-like protein